MTGFRGHGRPKSPSQKGWVTAQEELRSSPADTKDLANQYAPGSLVQAYQDEDENPLRKPAHVKI